MQEQAIELGVNDSIEWMGRQEQSCLQSLYDRIDILLMPSRSEGFGLTAIEGMARGCVVVASDTGRIAGSCKRWRNRTFASGRRCRRYDCQNTILIGEQDEDYPAFRNSVSYVSQFNFAKYAAAFCNLYERIKHIN